MDLLVVCADAGLSMEAALDRVGRELGDSYPSLTANIHMANLEIRAGRTMSEALEHLGDRLGLEEARSFATLIQQSEELGSSITEALRVYSDDMRHKRLSRAEEKAYSLPAKLSVPMMVCIFPVLFVVILLPVFVRPIRAARCGPNSIGRMPAGSKTQTSAAAARWPARCINTPSSSGPARRNSRTNPKWRRHPPRPIRARACRSNSIWLM